MDDLISQLEELKDALEELVQLQAHYAELLNMYDNGHRIQFTNAEHYLARRRETRCKQSREKLTN